MIDGPLKVDGYDDAIVGICAETNRFIYSIDKMVDVFIKNAGQFDDDEDPAIVAIDYILYNIVGAYMGEMTPIFCYDYDATIDNWGDDL